MEISNEQVQTILHLVEESDVSFFQLETGAFKLTISNGEGTFQIDQSTQNVSQAQRVQAPVPSSVPVRAAPAPREAAIREPEASARAGVSAQATDWEERGLVAVRAPMVGVFYSRPEPGAKPFVEPGSTVTRESTLALIEAMKLFSAVACPADGIVAEVLAADGDLIEYDQCLFLIEPAQ